MKKFILAFLLASGLSVASQPLYAEGGATNHTLSVIWENDIWAAYTDRDYTNGIRLQLAYEADGRVGGVDGALGRGLSALMPLAGRAERDGRVAYTFGIGQHIYTPEEIGVAELITNDRPYAGYLYGRVGVEAEAGDDFEALHVELGVVGPAAGAGEVQGVIHDIIGSTDPLGWPFQISNEPVANAYYSRARRFWLNKDGDTKSAIIPFINLAGGNFQTYAGGGAMLRIGSNIDRAFLPVMRNEAPFPGSSLGDTSGRGGWGFTLGGGVRYVAHNIVFEGGSIDDIYTVVPEDVVADIVAGVDYSFGNWRLSYTAVWRSKDYEIADESHIFAAIGVDYRF